jgi:hypothetical protein
MVLKREQKKELASGSEAWYTVRVRLRDASDAFSGERKKRVDARWWVW